MKRWFIALLAVVILVIISVYISIPGQINLSQTIRINCTAGAASRYLVNETNWLKWWPESPSLQKSISQNQPNAFIYNECRYQPEQKMSDAVEVRITFDKLTINSTLVLLPLNKDSVALQWQCQLNSSYNPFTRLQHYRQAAVIKNNMADILNKLNRFLVKDEKVYGFGIQKTTVKDTLLLVTRQVFDTWPSTQNIYGLISKLKTHMLQQGAQESGYPMLNIRNINSTHFETMVAIPVNKKVKEQNGIVMKYMVAGNILVAEVHGGVQTTNNAFAQMENYLLDHHIESPAVPFYSLITNRLTETDTSKWVTRIYYPIY